MKVPIIEPSLILLMGASGAGKSTFARKHFRPTEVLSSDHCRALVSDSENDQGASADAFEVLRLIASKRLARGLLTVVDATNVHPEARKPFLALAREHDLFASAIVLAVSDKVCAARNANRPDRPAGEHFVRRQCHALRRSLRDLKDEGFHHVFVLDSEADVDAAAVERVPLWNNRRSDHGPFDIVGDVHGCLDELVELLAKLGYTVERGEAWPFGFRVTPPSGRRVVFLGDLVDRGPRTPDVLRLVMGMVAAETALVVLGNHDAKLLRKLSGKNVELAHGLAASVAQLEGEPAEFREAVAKFIDGLISHYVLDDGKLVVAHAGLKEAYQGRSSSRVRSFALFGDTTGQTDEYGLPVRLDWAREYRGKAMVVYGHTPVAEPNWQNRTLNIDTGCVFGGKLSALRYPEREIVSVDAARVYCVPPKPLGSTDAPSLGAPAADRDNIVDLDDVTGRAAIETRLSGPVTIRAENAQAALEAMSRFAIDPRWLIYLPPTMSPCETSKRPDLLEHPEGAFAYFRQEGIDRVICEEKHMGSRAVVVLCRDRDTALRRFGDFGRLGVVYTRTGRPFFRDPAIEGGLLERIRLAADRAGLWERLESPWVCLDCEIMPWSAKALDLIVTQYGRVGAAARVGLSAVASALEQAAQRGLDVGALAARCALRKDATSRYVDAYRRYVWSTDGLSGLKVAPFHVLASEGRVHVDRDHAWHMQTAACLAEADPDLLAVTPFHVVDLTDEVSQAQGTQFWLRATESGGEGMVVKPFAFVARGKRGPAQPAVKVRGREYLRIIYGPEYTHPENLERLRARSLSSKRWLSLREFALGVEALERFVRREPLYRVHQSVFAVLALESEPVDPRL